MTLFLIRPSNRGDTYSLLNDDTLSESDRKAGVKAIRLTPDQAAHGLTALAEWYRAHGGFDKPRRRVVAEAKSAIADRILRGEQ